MSKYKKDEALPIEEFLYNGINPVIAPFLHEKLGLTPNGVTTIALIMGIGSVWLLHKDKYIVACLIILLRQVLDSTDGYIARTYNLSTPNGALYDIISDHVTSISIFIVLFTKFKHVFMNNKILLFALILSLIFKSILSKYRSSCIKKQNACKDEKIRHEILHGTRILSHFEMKILLVILILSLYNANPR